MTFKIINQRTHLYLGLALIPWVLMYGISSLLINHGNFFNKFFNDGTPQWSTKFEQEYHRPVPENADLKEVATDILNEFGLRNSFFVSRPRPDRLNIFVKDFYSPTKLTYFTKEGRLLVEERRFQWNTFIVGMHFRGGYQQDLFLDDLWAVLLDLVCIGFVVWISSGIYIWWKLRRLRLWGAVALAGGLVSFGWFLLAL
jgi:hypothetical protein